MENLGVVPWLRFFAFLLAPIFLFLPALLFLVTFVKETISLLLRGSSLIPRSARLVKRLSLVAMIFQVLAPYAHPSIESDHVISIGEHLEIPSRGLHRFSVTAQDVIAYKWLEHREKFLVEGKKIGYSELIVWDARKQKTTHRFYILSKRSFLKLKRIQKTLEGMGLTTSLQGHILVAKGVLERERDYFILHKVLRQNPKSLHLDVKLKRSLRNHLIGKAYTILFEEAPTGVSCQYDGIHITCFHQKEDTPAKEIKKKLAHDYAIKLVARVRGRGTQNYRIRLLIFKLSAPMAKNSPWESNN